MRKSRHPVFRAVWWSSHVLLAAALFALAYMGVREFSMRRYLDFQLREHMMRAGVAFFSTPEIKQ